MYKIQGTNILGAKILGIGTKILGLVPNFI